MHATTVPIKGAKWFAMPVNRNTVFLTDSFKQVAGYPNLVSGSFCTFSKDLELPLASGYFSIDPFNIQTGFKTCIEMFFNHWAAISIFCTYRAVVGALGTGETTFRKTDGFICFRIPQEIFLLKSKPEIIIIIFNCCPSVRFVCGSIRTQYFTHY